MNTPSRIVDAHMHFQSCTECQISPERFALDCEKLHATCECLAQHRLQVNYLDAIREHNVEGIIWHKSLSADLLGETYWAQSLALTCGLRHALVAYIDFLADNLEETLERCAHFPHLTAVCEYMMLDDTSTPRRFARHSDQLHDPVWRDRIRLTKRYDYRCGLKVFAHQLPDLVCVVRSSPDIGFTIVPIGWHSYMNAEAFGRWKSSLVDLSRCDNICVDISAMECIVGSIGVETQAAPWIRAVIETIGVSRCMFGSHLAIGSRAASFTDVYGRYAELVAGYSSSEIDELFFGVADRWFRPM